MAAKAGRFVRPARARPGDPAVLVLDVLTDFGFPHGPALRDALARRCAALTALLRRARRLSVPVIYVNDDGHPWTSDGPALTRRFLGSLRPTHRRLAALAPQATDSLVLKPRHSAFFGTPLELLLLDQGIGQLIVTGVSMESCVWMTACDAHVRGFGIVVPLDAVAGTSERAIQATLTGLRCTLRARTPRHARSVRLHTRRK